MTYNILMILDGTNLHAFGREPLRHANSKFANQFKAATLALGERLPQKNNI